MEHGERYEESDGWRDEQDAWQEEEGRPEATGERRDEDDEPCLGPEADEELLEGQGVSFPVARRFARALAEVLSKREASRPGRRRAPWKRVLDFLGVDARADLVDDLVPMPSLLRDLHLHVLDRFRAELAERFSIRVIPWGGRRFHRESVDYGEIEVGYEETRRVLVQGALLCEGEGGSVAILLDPGGKRGGARIEFVSPPDADEPLGRRLAEVFRERVEEAELYQGERLVLGRGGIRFLPSPGVGREDLVLPGELWHDIDHHVVDVVARPDRWRAAGLPPRRSLLLSGPPGVGKTQIGRYLADAVPATFLLVTTEGLRSGSRASAIFEVARWLAPAVLFLEDLDVACRGRRSLTFGELLAQLDGLHDNDGLVIIATSNDPEALDEALSDRPGRFDRHVRLGRPDPSFRLRLLSCFLRDVPLAGGEALLREIAERTAGLTGAHLQELTRSARIEAQVEAGWPAEPVPVDRRAFERALADLERSRPEVGFPSNGV